MERLLMDGEGWLPRRFLFLQGLASPFFACLAKALAERGHVIRRINFNGGDKLFWPMAGAVDFRGDRQDWSAFLSTRLMEWRITDVVLFGDCRPLHLKARQVARSLGVAVHVVEEGYLRPNWITFERGGVNGHSSLPRDPSWYRSAAQGAPAWSGGIAIHNLFHRRALDDVLYSCAVAALAWRYPHYRTHRPWNPFLEYAGWVLKTLRRALPGRGPDPALHALINSDRPFFVMPLQLDSDAQLRRHSPFGGMLKALERAVDSFANHAPATTYLIVREHPLDNGLKDWRALTLALGRSRGIGDRVLYMRDGDLGSLLASSRGVITVNSTTGVVALSLGKPVTALGSAIYDMPDLTHQAGLDRFWTHPQAPDPETFDAFRRVVAHRTQINGGFFSDVGIRLAVAGAVRRLEGSSHSSLRGQVDAHIADERPWPMAALPFEPDAPIT